MDKWADYLISEVSYDAQHLISFAIRHMDTNKGITKGESVDRLTISSDIKNGISYVTIYSRNNSWKKGHSVRTFSISGDPFLRIDRNKVKLDFLGDLPSVSNFHLEKFDLAPEPVTEEPSPEPAPSSPRGSLPKESAEELPQELDLAPEPVTEEPSPEPEDEEATPEQLARLEQLEKQIQELESEPSPEPAPSSPRGSLPKESAEELPQELDLAPEPVTEEPSPEPEDEEATPEQLEQLDELQKQLNELEIKLSAKPVPKIQSESEIEPVIEEYSESNDLEDQMNELEDELFSKLHPSSDESTEEQISKINQLEKEIEKLESVDIEHEIIQSLQKQNKKLNDIEKKLDKPFDDATEAYCVKCKTKRKIKNPEEIIMKNGRSAIKGVCSTCNCKVFRIGKMKK